MHCSNATLNSSEKTSPTSDVTENALRSASASASASSYPSSIDPSECEGGEASSEHQRSLYSFHPKILQPFMGLKKIDHEDDPWHHKPYNLYQPIFTGGGTFESLLNRYRRNVSYNSGNPRPTVTPHTTHQKHVLTPNMLERLLRIKMNFEKNYPFLYKTMMGHLTGDKHTSLSITPPEIPEHVSYPNVELAAAEIDQLETLLKQLKKEKYQQQLEQQQQLQENEMEDHYQYQQQSQPQRQYQKSLWSSQPSSSSSSSQEAYDPLVNSYNEEKSFWDEIQQQQQPVIDSTTTSPAPPTAEDSFWEQFQDSLELPSTVRKRESFWSTLEAAEERQNQQRDRQIADDLDHIFNFDDED